MINFRKRLFGKKEALHITITTTKKWNKLTLMNILNNNPNPLIKSGLAFSRESCKDISICMICLTLYNLSSFFIKSRTWLQRSKLNFKIYSKKSPLKIIHNCDFKMDQLAFQQNSERYLCRSELSDKYRTII